LRPERHEPRIVMREEAEVGGGTGLLHGTAALAGPSRPPEGHLPLPDVGNPAGISNSSL
jgi:hypothetical protein